MKLQVKKMSWLLAVMMLAVSGCASSPDGMPEGADGSGLNSTGSNSVYEGGGGYNAASDGDYYDNQQYGKDIISGPSSPAKDRVIYFSFDNASFDERAIPIIQAHSNFLIKNPMSRILLEGNTDERGSRGYNIALGERRAVTVLKEMVRLGVPAKQIRIISYGEERPAVDGHDETVYARNRRVVIQY